MIRKALTLDFEFFYMLYMHEQTNPYLLYEMMDRHSFQPIWSDLLQKQVLYVFEHDNNGVGMFKLIQLQHRNAHIAYLGGVAIHPDFAGKGLGNTMLQEIIELGKTMHLLRIELSTATSNERAIYLYEKLGFKKEGVLRNYTYLAGENRFLDEVMMSYLY